MSTGVRAGEQERMMNVVQTRRGLFRWELMLMPGAGLKYISTISGAWHDLPSRWRR